MSSALTAAEPNAVRITFLPPPLEGTLSLGIYDKAGKLVRTLHREAGEKDFTVGLNGFITHWDGNDDAGQPAPAGKYAARGFAVGEVDVEGVAMHCNDWVTGDDPPRIRTVLSVRPESAGFSILALISGDERPQRFGCTGEGVIESKVAATADEAVVPNHSEEPKNDARKFRGVISPSASTPSRGGGIWLIDDLGDHREVKEFTSGGELRRRLVIDANDPQPQRLAIDPRSEALFLIEENPAGQRVRGLALDTPAEVLQPGREPVSTWKEFLSRTITASQTFTVVADKLGRPKPFAPEEKVRIRLLPNELTKREATEVDAQVAIDAQGSYLKASDGLPLRRITETAHLKWAVMGREGGRVITVFQSDGAVVEEFKVRKLANMMGFDAGEYEWPPAAAK